jgi:NitT/TauT family transport system substrate-binding protein
MARLTPMAKGLLALIILGGAGALAWNFGLKEMVSHRQPAATGGQAADSGVKPGAKSTPVPRSVSGPLGSAGNPLRVSIVSFHGYAPALVANGNSLTTQPGSIYAGKGVNVEFVIQDDIPTLSTIFESNTAQCAWRTSDSWAQEQPNLRNAGGDGRAIIVVDNTQGADAIITRDASIQRIEDLAGKSVALLQYTPSHGLTIDALENSALSARKRESVKYVYVNADEGTAGVRAALESGSVDAAVLWDPDLSLAIKNVKGARVVYSTKTATNLIYDVMVCNKKALDDPANTKAFQAFVDGWLTGVQEARANPDKAVTALENTEELFKLLIKDQGRDFVKGLFGNLVWTGLDDNARILGLVGGTNHYERVYHRFDGIYRAAGALANPNSPVINASDSFDYRFIKTLLDSNQAAKAEAAKPKFSFTQQEQDKAAQQPAIVTKPVMVNFTSGSADLNKRAQQVIDKEMVPFIENNGAAYFEVSGNTDSVGSRDTNLRLSHQRAQAVVDYLVKEWSFERARFKVIGAGPDHPLCNEAHPEADGIDLETCRANNRSTRVALLTR